MIIPDFRLETRLLLGGVMAIAIVSSAQAVDTYAIGECRTATQSSGVEIRPLTTADSYLTIMVMSYAIRNSVSIMKIPK